MEQYVIEAYSPTAQQTVREFNLEGGLRVITQHNEALMAAAFFAARMNRDQYLQATDWQPKFSLQTTGIETLDSFLFNDPNR